MNNIFKSYNNNLYIETIKSDINLQVPLSLEVINNITQNYFNTTFHIKQQGLTKFIKTVVNLYFSHITKADLRPLLLLGFEEIKEQILRLNQARLVNLLIQKYNNQHPNIILSEIVSSLSYNNRDTYALNFRLEIQKLFMNEKFEMKPLYQYNDKYYLLDLGDNNKTFHSNIDIYNNPNNSYFNTISNDKNKFIYIKNLNNVESLLKSVDKKIVEGNSYTVNMDYYVLVKKYATELKNINNLLIKREIPFNKFTEYIYNNRKNKELQDLTVFNILEKIFFNDYIKELTVDTNLNTLDQDELNKYIFNLLRSLTSDELKELFNINDLILKLIETNNDSFLNLLNNINLIGLENINFKDYNTLEQIERNKLIERLNNINIINIIYNLDKDYILNNIDTNKLKAKIIERNQ
jgi:hypothetical protein